MLDNLMVIVTLEDIGDIAFVIVVLIVLLVYGCICAFRKFKEKIDKNK